jgi:hypothetical protein
MIIDLSTGLSEYRSTDFYAEACALDERARALTALIVSTAGAPAASSLSEAKDFLIAVERWKAGCLEQRMGNAATNTEGAIWEAFTNAIGATTDIEKLRSIMRLRGFGASIDPETGQRRAKVATSVLRFLLPEEWGVVDWRNAAMLGFLDKNNWIYSEAVSEATSTAASQLRECFDLINEGGAKSYNDRYREISQEHSVLLPRAADVDMALFGMSLLAWRMGG